MIGGMEDYRGKSAQVGELETCTLAPSDVACIIAVLAGSVCRGGGYRRFVFIKKNDCNVVCDAARRRTRTETTASCRKPSST